MFYVLDENHNLIPAYDKEGVLAVLAQAIADGSLSGIEADSAFVSKLKCCVTGGTNKVAFVTQAKYNEMKASGGLHANTLYFITDDTTAENLDSQLAELASKVNGIDATLAGVAETVSQHSTTLAGVAETVSQHSTTLAGILNGGKTVSKAINAVSAGTANTAGTAEVLQSTAAVVFEATISDGVAVVNIDNNDKYGVYVIQAQTQTGVKCMGVVFAYPNMDMEGIANNSVCKFAYNATNKQITCRGATVTVTGMVAYQILRV